ncbi:methyl-accepting chemotaxis protein McpC [Sagittula stellata E-37]|uniref:Methyl-accepting chemotaxis protein McpC n=2 Tax=Sagittula stellata TaxID=52603 RepID=A3K239_SAGS3|nr:methyl-accepting chemotaxis protein McpC [Sagittula stellata E-37]
MALTTVVVAGVLSVNAMRLLERMAVAEVNVQGERAAVKAAEDLAKPLRFNVADKIGELATQAFESVGDSAGAAVVFGAEGDMVVEIGIQDDQAALSELVADVLESGTVSTADGGRVRAVPIMAGADGPVIGVFGLTVSYDAKMQEVWTLARWMFVLAAVTFVVMMSLTLYLLSRALGRPLKALSSAVSDVAEGIYDTQHGMSGRKDEIGGIARNLDSLLEVLRAGRAAEESRAEKMASQIRVVEELGQALDSLAHGMLHRRIEMEFPKEYTSLRDNYNRAVDRLREVVEEVKEGAQSILGSSDRIASASGELSRRTETQAATLEQSAAAMEEMLNSVRSAAKNASDANATAHSTREIAERNGEVMKSAVGAMGEIEKSSGKISEITTVIDDIAFQTNLLALNAGVEAARAGEAGKGFAVVASEVQGLAQRSAEAAQQIKDLIQGSGERVRDGVRLVEAAGTALQDVLDKVADMSRMVEGIASSADDQAQGLNEINTGIANLDRVTQQNAAMVEQSTAAARMLNSDADSLNDLVSRFATRPEEPVETKTGKAA